MTAEASLPRLQVLLVVKGLGLGGAERLLVDQALAASARCAYAVAHVRPDKVHFAPELAAHGVEVVSLRPAGRRVWPLALARELRRRRPDVVHVHSPLPAAVARLLVRLGVAGRRSVVITTEHNRWSAYRWPTRVVNAATLVLDHHTFAVSEEARASVWPRWLGRRVETLHHGIDLGAVRAAAAQSTVLPDRPPGAFTVVHVANRRPEKAHEVLLAAFDLAAEDDPDLHLWLVGQRLDDPDLVAAIDGLAHRGRVEVLGYRSDAPALLAAGDALVLSSDHEGLPVAVMEALALGRPVVSTAVGGVPEAVRDGVEALLVPRRDPEALASALVRLHREPGLHAVLAEGAAARAAAFDGRVAHRVQEDRYHALAAARR